MKLQSIFDQTDFVHASGTKEELQVANYLKEQCEALGVPAKLEGFRVAMGEIEEAHLYADGMEISCKALTCCGSGSVEGELYYMPGTDPVSVAGAKDKIVLMDTLGIAFAPAFIKSWYAKNPIPCVSISTILSFAPATETGSVPGI